MKNNLKFPNTFVVYLNFCGIGKSGNALTRYIKRYDCRKLFISFCSRKSNFKLKGDPVFKRGHFLTYCV